MMITMRMDEKMKHIRHQIMMALCVAALLLLPGVPSAFSDGSVTAVHAAGLSADATGTFAGLTTFYGTAVSDSYDIPLNASTMLPVEVVAQGSLRITLEHQELPTEVTLRICTNDQGLNPVISRAIAPASGSETLTLTAGGSEMLYLFFDPVNVTEAVSTFSISTELKAVEQTSVISGRTLKSGSWTRKRVAGSSKAWYKLSVKKACYVILGSSNSDIQVQIYRADKKTKLSRKVSLRTLNNYKASFSLRKGSYYCAVTSSYSTPYQLYYETRNVSGGFGKTMAKASRMSWGKTRTGYITADGVPSKYYKFRVNKSRKFRITFYTENASDSFVLRIYDSNHEELPVSGFKMKSGSLLNINSRVPMPKGTYYLRVSKSSKWTSGVYELTLNSN